MPLSDGQALLAAIRAAHEDDAPRLVYADWLDEHGQPEQAEFIRVQIELTRRNSAALRRREAALLATHHDASSPVRRSGRRENSDVFPSGSVAVDPQPGVFRPF